MCTPVAVAVAVAVVVAVVATLHGQSLKRRPASHKRHGTFKTPGKVDVFYLKVVFRCRGVSTL